VCVLANFQSDRALCQFLSSISSQNSRLPCLLNISKILLFQGIRTLFQTVLIVPTLNVPIDFYYVITLIMAIGNIIFSELELETNVLS
jgi:hypothetical protein